MKTIKQMADSLKIDKQRVYRFIRKNRISEVHQKAGVMYYDEAVEMQVQRHFLKFTVSSEVHQTASNDAAIDAVISMLQRELESKNALIESQQQSIRELTAALENTTTSLQAAQALHAGTMQKQITGKNSEPTAPVVADESPAAATNKRGLFARMFGRK